MVGTVLAFAVLGEEPSVWDLGAIGVFIGLLLVVYDKHDMTDLPVIAGMWRILSQQEMLAGKLSGTFSRGPRLKTAKSGDKSTWSEVL
jgi:hypothetical protein